MRQVPLHVALFDREMNYLACSEPWLQHYGRGHTDLLGANHYALVPDMPEAWKRVFRRALDGETVRSQGESWLDEAGAEHWLRWVVKPWTDESGGVAGLIVVTEEVTDAQRTLRDLQEAHRRFATVFEQAPVAMAVGALDDLRFAEVNAAFETLSGWSRDEMRGRTSAEFGLWPDAAWRSAVHEQLRREGLVPGGEARLRRRDGELVDVAFSACRVEISGRAHFVAMLVDITPLQQARRVLLHQHEELETLVAQRTTELAAANATLAERAAAIADLYDKAPCGYHSLSVEGVFTAINQTELEMLGYTRDELIGQPLVRILTPASQEAFRARYAEFRERGEVRDLDYEVVRKDGRVVPVLISAVMVRDGQGRHVGNRAIMVDNSEREARERQIEAMQRELLRRADQAETATRAKSAFLANMSHEIRTPMNAIIGLIHLLARDATDALQRSRLGKVDAAARHLLEVINDILDLSKVEAGKMVLESIEFSLYDLADRVADLVAPKAREKGLELVLDLDHAPDRLRGDPTRLSQALLNLLGNAVKFTAAGWVRLRVLRLPDDEGSDRGVALRFEVQDTGIGIPVQTLPQLFEAFEQADASTTRRHGGTGLGLALTRHLARLMGGEVGVDSRPGVGSCFWLTVRLQAAPEAPPPPPLPTLAGRRVLLVDDLPEALQAIADRLRLLGLEVDALQDPVDAVARMAGELAAGRAYALLVLDWCMQPLDGGQLLNRLRALAGAALPPTLLVTADDSPLMRQQAHEAGFDAVLVKPVGSSALHDALVQLLGGAPRVAVFPAASAGPDTPADESAEWRLRACCRGRRVLLAEDNPINREVAFELLTAVGLQLETAADGLEAVRRALDSRPDLVLMDVQMPGIDGLEATRRLRAAGLHALPIIAMTANAFGEDRVACLAAGMNDHVAKPVDVAQLYATLLRWLEPTAAMPTERAAAPAPAHPAPPPPPAPPPLQDRLAGIPGLDLPAVLRQLGDDGQRLRRVLERFVALYGGGVGALDRAALHSLRGACAAVGAAALGAVGPPAGRPPRPFGRSSRDSCSNFARHWRMRKRAERA
ncbi:MAG: hypothetical protein ABS84_03095 [Rubrivivax sp. SCN 71-131]|nr:MAG: hypothetical protein ABS84_03095 [Rubrivivax sp. SCN 71-131]